MDNRHQITQKEIYELINGNKIQNFIMIFIVAISMWAGMNIMDLVKEVRVNQRINDSHFGKLEDRVNTLEKLVEDLVLKNADRET